MIHAVGRIGVRKKKKRRKPICHWRSVVKINFLLLTKKVRKFKPPLFHFKSKPVLWPEETVSTLQGEAEAKPGSLSSLPAGDLRFGNRHES